MWIAPSIELTNEERVALEARVRAHKTPQRAVKRARIVLLAAGGMPNRQIAIEVEMSEQAVGKWRQRFERLRLKGLEDAPGRGRPRRLGHEERLRVVAKATQETPEVDSQWSHASLSQALAKDGVRISPSQVGRILADTDVKPHRVQGWLNRKDTPEFWERAADVCGLYLNCPENAVVLSVDEKTAMVAREPKAPTKAPRPATLDAEGKAVPGTPARKEFEYRRHGTASIVAALDVHSGNVMAEDVPRNNSVNFTAFLARLDEATPKEYKAEDGTMHQLSIHLVMDNGSSHTSKATQAWLAEHPRFVVHYTPKHASWLNQVELVFSILSRKLLRRGEFSSREDLVAKVMAFIEHYDRTAKPFAWTYEAKPLKVA